MKSQLTTKLGNCVNKLKQYASDTASVKSLQEEIKSDLKNMNDHVSHDLRKAIRVFSDQLHNLATKRTEEITRLHDMVHKVSIELAAKKELREKDSEHWSGKYNQLLQEKDELAQQMDDEIMRCNAEIADYDKQRQSAQTEFEDSRRTLHADSEELERKKAALTGMIETARRHCVQLDAANTRLEEDRQHLQDQEKQMRNDIRESDSVYFFKECQSRVQKRQDSIAHIFTVGSNGSFRLSAVNLSEKSCTDARTIRV